MKKGLKTFGHTIGQSMYHMVWAPKYRRHVLKPFDIAKACEVILKVTAQKHGILIHELRVMPDHIHLFAEIPPRISPSMAFMYLKGRSSRVLRQLFPWLRKMYPNGHMWSKGKFLRSIGSVTADTIEHYIQRSEHNWKYFDVREEKHGTSQLTLASFQT